MKYTKVYQKDYRKGIMLRDFKKNLNNVEINDIIVGFIDEMAVEGNVNRTRFWKDWILRKVATYLKVKVIGFYPLNGKGVVDFPDSNRIEDFISFLRKIREVNPEKRIVIILDNFKTHHAKKVKEESEKLDIQLVYLPPYSPDLNPIEYVWKSVKRYISEESPLNIKKLKEIISKSFKKLTKSISFAGSY
ncbi:IS630 family transposase [Methanothermococcus sp. SCGC AD-155-C09]|nr:IS630 family transposase [Methanothermococcus sp. SCGC AD-155-C09]